MRTTMTNKNLTIGIAICLRLTEGAPMLVKMPEEP